MTVKLLKPYPPYVAGDLFTADANTETGLVSLGVATTTLTGGVTPNLQRPVASTTVAGALVLSADYRIQAVDEGAVFYCTVPLTITWPAGLTPRPSCVVHAPESGVVTLVGVFNGSPQTLTRTLANNPCGFAVMAYQNADGYGAGGR